MGAVQRRGAVSKQAVILVVVMVLVIGAAAWYSDRIGLFFKLQAWDTKAPARVVEQFLAAVEERQQERANSLLTEGAPKPLVREGKWIGYGAALPTGPKMEYRLADLGDRSAVASARTEFVYIGDGGAIVTLPGGTKGESTYRLKRVGSHWRITEIPGLQFAQ